MTKSVYRQIYKEILGDVTAGRLSPGAKLSSERNLCEKHKVSITSVRKALELLCNEGIIEKRHGSGNYIKDLKSQKEIGLLVGSLFHKRVFSRFIENINSCQDGFKIKLFVANAKMERLDSFAIKQILAKNNMPFLILTDRNFSDMAKQEIITPLDKLSFTAKFLDCIPDPIRSSFRGSDGVERIFKLPVFMCPTVFAINENLAKKAGLPLEEPPQIWSDVLSWCKTFTKWRDKNDKTLFAAHLEGGKIFTTNLSYYLMASGNFSSSCDEVDAEGMKELVCFFSELYENGYARNGEASSPDAFVSGKYLLNLSARSWIPTEMDKYNPSMKCMLLPMPAANKMGSSKSAVGSIGFGIAPNGKMDNIEVCAKAMETIFSSKALPELAYKMGIVPANLAHFRDMIKLHPEFQPFYDTLPCYCQEPDSEKNTRIVHETDYCLSRKLMLNDFDTDEAVDRIRQMISHACQFEKSSLTNIKIKHEVPA